MGHVDTADDVAHTILFLASDLARHITGEILNVMVIQSFVAKLKGRELRMMLFIEPVLSTMGSRCPLTSHRLPIHVLANSHSMRCDY